MSTKDLITWIVLIVLVAAGLGIWIFQAKPTQDEISQAVQPLPPLGVTTLTAETFADLSQREVNGSLPVQPAPSDSSRTDPFN